MGRLLRPRWTRSTSRVIDLFAISAGVLSGTGAFGKPVILSYSLLMLPDTVKFIVIIGLVVGAIYGSAYGLATFPPEPAPVIKSLPHEKLRQK
jgi:hypothetical protein